MVFNWEFEIFILVHVFPISAYMLENLIFAIDLSDFLIFAIAPLETLI